MSVFWEIRREWAPHTVNFPVLDGIADCLRAFAVYLTADAERRAQNLLHGTFQLLGKGLVAHGPCDLNNLIEADRLVVLDVLFFLPVSRGLLQSSDDQGRSRRHNRDCCLPVLDCELDRDPEALL